MEKHKDFPGFWSAVLVLALLFGLQIIITIVAYDLGYVYEAGDPAAAGLVTVVSSGVIFSLLMSYKKLGYRELFNSSSNSMASIVLTLTLPIFLTVGGGVFWISEITNLLTLYFPVDEGEYSIFDRFMGSGVVSVLVICVIGPVIEEMLFRGIILRGFLANYTVQKSIILSSVLFALYHMNLYQIPVAFILGCFLGWLYARTRSLWPCIVAHISYNACVMWLWSNYDIGAGMEDHTSIMFNLWWVNILAVLSSVVGVFMLVYILKPAINSDDA